MHRGRSLKQTHRVSEVHDDEGAVGGARLPEVGVWLAAQVLVVQLLDPAGIRTFGHLEHSHTNMSAGAVGQWTARSGTDGTDPALLVQQVEHAQLTLHQADAQLIVAELDPLPGQLLPNVLLLFQVEDMLRTRKNTDGRRLNGLDEKISHVQRT